MEGSKGLELKEKIKSIEELIIETHDSLVDLNGDPRGLRSGASLYFIIYGAMREKGSVIDFALKLMKSIAEKHPFVEGNKRTAYVIGKLFLLDDGFLLCLSDDIAVKYMRNLARKKEKDEPWHIEEIKSWILIHSELFEREGFENYIEKGEIPKKYLRDSSKTRTDKIKKYISKFSFGLGIKKRGKLK